MRTKIEYDQLTRQSRKLTLINISEKLPDGSWKTSEWQLRHALQAMKVQPEKFKLAPGEKLPKGISLDMVPPGTTIKDVEEFERIRGTVGKVTKTTFDNVLDAIENGIEIADVEVPQDSSFTPGAEFTEDEIPKDYVPTGVDLIPADSMKDPSAQPRREAIADEESALDKAENDTPELSEIQEKELNFEEAKVNAPTKFTKKTLEPFGTDKLQAILLNLPTVKSKSEKYQKDLLKSLTKKDQLIENIIQLSQVKQRSKK